MTMRRKIWLALGSIVGLIVLMTLGTQWVFVRFEGRSLDFATALLFVVETITTTGYGEQLPFKSSLTALWSVLLMVTGFVQISVWVTSLASSWVQANLQVLPPTHVPHGLENHVIICGAGPVGTFLANELEQADLPYVLVDDRRPLLENHMRQGLAVMEGNVHHVEAFQAARIETARAVVSTLRDSDDASVALIVRAIRPDIPICCMVEHAENERFLQAAGATHLVLAKRTLGERLGWLTTAPLAGMLDRLWGPAGLGVCTVPVLPGSALAVPTLREARIREQTGANILGVWSHGQFMPVTDPDMPLRPGHVLVAAGSQAELERLSVLSAGQARPVSPQGMPVLILGYGDVGQAVAERLQRAGVPYRILSLALMNGETGVDWVQGDATDADDLQRAGVADAGYCVVALDDDTRSVFATLLVRQLNPGLRIAARANSIEAVTRLYLAGADNVLSVSEVAGTQLARLIQAGGAGRARLEDVETRLVAVPLALVGKNLVDGQVGRNTGCIVMAVQTESGAVETTPPPERVLCAGEKLVLFGTAEQFDRFTRAYS